MTATGPSPVTALAEPFGAATDEVVRVAARDGAPGHVRKVLSPHAGNVHGMGPGVGLAEQDCHYWAREYRFYRAFARGELGSWADLPLRPATPYGFDERPDGALVLTLEDVAEPPGDWRAPDYREVAAHLGVFNGHHFLRPLPDPPGWLSRSWLRWWFTSMTPAAVSGLRTLTPDARAALAEVTDPKASVAGTTALWRARSELLARLDRVPVALAHLDANRLNLLRAEPGRSVAVDWSYVGVEALGTDAAQLFASSAARLLVPADDLAAFHDAVLDGYVAGLRSAGVPGEVLSAVPGWYDLAICLRWGAAHLFWARGIADPERRPVLEQRWWRRPFAQAAPDLALLDRYLSGLTERTLA
ncbi:hypothetical protein AB0N81_03295 [Streptomyces sp. NPDC093510]|uniref:hypothetical protein n=1 Tax=Streptomyces sp. NPDC093510 TaxID=3155199 RepID=UPI00344247C0